MATPDMDVIKEIPGYKVILKAILKSQIQQLVEQLASCTDEESVILTASVSDGTLSHLGSDSGKFFLDDHEDIKSQFLGFCLKRHHRKKMEKEREEAMKNVQVAAPQYGMRSPSNARQAYMQRSPRMVSPRQQGSQMFSRSTTNPGVRGQLRHEPYTLTRPKRTSLSFDNQGPGGSMHPPPATSTSAVVKIEPDTDNDSAETSGEITSQTPSQGQVEVEREDDAKSNSSSSTIPNDLQDVKFSDSQQASGLSLDSDLSNLIGENSQQSNSNDNMLDAESGLAQVKKEAVDDSEMDLEITGVEPGRPIPPPQPQEMWAVNSPGGFEQSGAAGSSGDMAGYKTSRDKYSQKGKLKCSFCRKEFPSKAALITHERVHTGEKPFVCDVCGKGFTQKGNMRSHMIMHIRSYDTF